MKLHRFFVEQSSQSGGHFSIVDEALLHQWKSVFRLGAGDRVILLDNTGDEFECEFEMLSKENADLVIKEKRVSQNISKQNVNLYFSLIKKDNVEWVLQKCTELGVNHFFPIISERSEKKDINFERAKKIIKESSEQSSRAVLPTLHEITDLSTALGNSVNPVVLHTEENGAGKELKIFADTKDISIFIGPEGGWSPKEVLLFKEKKVPIIRLGNQVLRAETASVAVCALLLLD